MGVGLEMREPTSSRISTAVRWILRRASNSAFMFDWACMMVIRRKKNSKSEFQMRGTMVTVGHDYIQHSRVTFNLQPQLPQRTSQLSPKLSHLMSGLLRSQFSNVEETFLTSMIEPPEMESFAHFWSGLQLTVAEGIKQQILDEKTLPYARGIACKVKTMAELLMDLYEKSDAFTASFQNDLAPLFADLSVDRQSSLPSHPIPPKPG